MERIVKRIAEMENCYDKLKKGVYSTPPTLFPSLLQNLLDYYHGLWRVDFELDERGALPSDLKRGVLSEDGVYNLLTDISDIFGYRKEL